MPITPFHFGPALLFKSALPARFSFSAFVITQVVIDVETAYNMARQAWPLHARLHTVAGGLVVGLAVAAIVWMAGPRVVRMLGLEAHRLLSSEISATGAIVGGLTGGVTHALLDSMVHTDVQPFMPLTTAGSLHGLASHAAVHFGCILSGIVGACVLLFWIRRTSRQLTGPE